MTKNISRREFFRLATVMGGATLFAGCHLLGENPIIPGYIHGAPGVDPLENLLGIKNVYSVCALCPGNCGIRCRVAQGVVVKIGGSPFHPATSAMPLAFDTSLEDAVNSSGSICAVGGAGIQTLYDPFRVIKPLKRVGPRGSNKWTSLSWDQAAAEIVHGGDLFGEGPVVGLKDLANSQGGFQFLLGRTDWASTLFVKTWLGGFSGAVLLRDSDVHLHERASIAADAIFGQGTGRLDANYTEVRCVIGFGDTPLDSGEPLVTAARQIAEARSKPLSFLWAVVDPRLSTSATKSDLWVPVLPGRDHELALGVMRSFLDRHGSKLRVPRDVLEATLGITTTSQYAQACGVAPEMVHRLADYLAQGGDRSAVIPGKAIYAQPFGMETARTILMLNAMVGSVPDQGGLARRASPFFAAVEKKVFEKKGYEIKEASSTSGAGALFVWQANPVYDDPTGMIPLLSDTSRIGLTIVIDRDMTETAAYADYILPDTTYLERWDICESPPVVRNPGIGIRVPVVGGIDPRNSDYFPIFPETKIAEDILALIGASVGLEGFRPDESGRRKNAFHYFRNSLNLLSEALQTDGFYESGMPPDYSQIIDRGGMFVKPKPLETKSRVHTVSLSAIKSSPSTTPGAADGDELVLISYSLPFNRTSRSVVNRWLLEVLPVNRLLMNPRDAEQRGIQQGDRIRLQATSSRFTGECSVQLVPGIRPGVVALAQGFGHTQFGANPMVVDATVSSADKTRATGINPHAVSSGPDIARVRISKV